MKKVFYFLFVCFFILIAQPVAAECRDTIPCEDPAKSMCACSFSNVCCVADETECKTRCTAAGESKVSPYKFISANPKVKDTIFLSRWASAAREVLQCSKKIEEADTDLSNAKTELSAAKTALEVFDKEEKKPEVTEQTAIPGSNIAGIDSNPVIVDDTARHLWEEKRSALVDIVTQKTTAVTTAQAEVERLPASCDAYSASLKAYADFIANPAKASLKQKAEDAFAVVESARKPLPASSIAPAAVAPVPLLCTPVLNQDTGLWKGLDACRQCGTCEFDDFIKLGVNAAKYILGLVGALAFLMFVYGGSMMLISAGSPERVKTGQKILVNAVIGLIIVLTSWLIVQFSYNLLGVKYSQTFNPEAKDQMPKKLE